MAKIQAQEDVKKFADRLDIAYSTDEYGTWDSCIKMLRKRGYSDREIEAVILSKWTRWAADMSGKSRGRNTGADLAKFLDKYSNRTCSKAELAKLVAETFPEDSNA